LAAICFVAGVALSSPRMGSGRAPRDTAPARSGRWHKSKHVHPLSLIMLLTLPGHFKALSKWVPGVLGHLGQLALLNAATGRDKECARAKESQAGRVLPERRTRNVLAKIECATSSPAGKVGATGRRVLRALVATRAYAGPLVDALANASPR